MSSESSALDLGDDKAANDGNTQISASEPDTRDAEKQPIPSEEPAETWITGIKLWTVMAGITLACFLMVLDVSILSTAIPVITSDFQSLENVGWYGAAYQLASAAIQPLTGKIYSYFDTKWTFFAFFLVFELGSLLCGLSNSSNMLIVSRAVAGMGASGLQNGAFTILAGCAPMHKRPMLLSIVISAAQLGLVAGPLFGGLFTEYVSWRWCFYINLPVGGVIAALLCFIHVPEQVKKPPFREVLRDLHNKLDLLGFVIFAPSVTMLLLAVQFGGNQYAWNSSVVIGLFCGAGVLSLVWLSWDYYKKDDAMIPLPMLKSRYVWSSCLVLLFLSSAMFMTSYYLPIYFQGVLGKSPAISGVYLLPSILSQLFLGLVSGKATGYFGYYLPWSVLSAVLTAVGYGLLSTLSPLSSTGQWVGYQILFGAGRGFGMQVPVVAVQNTLKPAQISVAMSLLVFSQTIGGALFLSFSGTIFTNSLQSLLEQDAPHANTEAIINAGAYGFRRVVPQASLADVLDVYAHSIDRVFYMCTGLAGCCFIFSWAMGWVDIRKKSAQGNSEKKKQTETID